MLKETLMFAGGVALGAALVYGTYRYYQCCKNKDNTGSDKETIDDDNTIKKSKLDSLIADRIFIKRLTAKELIGWFKDNASQHDKKTKNMLLTPTEDHMQGLGYPSDSGLDVSKNLLQLILKEEEDGELSVLKIRLISFEDINSNLQACLIERDGMLIVTV